MAMASSCQNSPSPSKQALRINIQNEPQSLDPRKARAMGSVAMTHMLFEGLYRVGRNGETEKALAESVEISEDGKVYIFTLRDSKWSNGDPVTSYDFAYSWRKMLDPAFPTDLGYQLERIKGAKLVRAGEMSVHQVAIQTPNPKTLIVELEQPTPYFCELLTLPSFFPVSQRVDTENPHWAEEAKTYVCNGPFVLKEWKHSDIAVAERNSNYWDANSVALKEIELLMVQPETELRMFFNHEIDWAGSPLSTLSIDALGHLKQEHQLKVRPLLGTSFIRINAAQDLFLGESRFRRALALALDRQKITEHVLQGGQLPALALVPPQMGLAEKGYFCDANFLEAQNLLTTVLAQKNRTISDIPCFQLTYIAGERAHVIAQAVQQQIEETLGVHLELEAVELKTYYERLSKKQYQLMLGSWIADFNDPINFLEVFKYEGNSSGNGWENSKYIERLDSSAVCRDIEERKSVLREAEQALMDQMPFIPIFHFSINYLKQEGVEDVCLSPTGQIDFRWSRIEDRHPL